MRHWKKLAALAVALVTFAGIGLAWAAWTAGGNGTGAAKAGTATALTTSAATATDSLYPSGSADVALTINNPNPYQVTVTSVTGNGNITSDKAGCTAANNGVTFDDQPTTSIVIAAHDSTTTHFTGAAHMSNASVDACQGATFTIPVTVSGASS